MSFLYNKTRIVATVGPACSSVPILKRMLRAGLKVAPFNFSHGEFGTVTTVLPLPQTSGPKFLRC
jgi:pyruvate kinase